MPEIVRHPENAWVIRGHPARLSCAVSGADKAYFTCNGEAMAASKAHKEVDQVMPTHQKASTDGGEEVIGVRTVKALTLTITRNQVEEFFGVYTCRCDAWTSKGNRSSKNATVEIACEFFQIKFSRDISPLYSFKLLKNSRIYFPRLLLSSIKLVSRSIG